MIKTLYSIYDSTADNWGQPAPQDNDQVAIRSFSMIVNDPNGIVGMKPSDFSIWKVGTFDDSTGTILPLQPEKLANGDSLKEE